MNVSEKWEVATKELSRNDPVIMKIIKLYSGYKMQLKNNAFLTLVRSVVGQQISVKAADSVWKKLEELCRDSIEPERIKSFSEDELRSAGLSRSKANYIQNIAKSDILWLIKAQGSKNYILIKKDSSKKTLVNLSLMLSFHNLKMEIIDENNHCYLIKIKTINKYDI